MVVIVSNFDQRVDVTLRCGARPLRQRKSCSVIGCFNGSEARQTQNASIYKVQTTRQLQRMAKESVFELTLVQDIREVVLGHF